MRSTLCAIVALVTLDPAALWLTVPVLARTLRAEDVEISGDWQLLWRPLWTPTSDGASAASRAVQASTDEQPPWAGRPGQAGSAADDDNGAEGEVDDRPARTYMRCLGTTTATRACHFQAVYYDIDSGHFIYYGPAGTRAELFGAAMPADDPWLRLIRGWDTWKDSKHKRTQFFLDWRGGKAPPAAELVAEFTQPLHLRAAMNTRSLGHFIRDDVLPLIDLPMRFGRDPVDFDWVRWESDLAFSDWEEETRLLEHYRGLHNSRPSVTWQEVLDQALQGQHSSIKFIRFAEIVAGQGPADLMSHVALSLGVDAEKMSQWAHMCDPYPFTAMREVAYRNHGLQVASVSELEPFVLFLDGRVGEKRFLANAEELIPNLKKTFPGVRMENVVISSLDLQEQLEYLSKATVVVSNIGSRSFRLVYLPNGATTILVGPPEYEVTIEPTEPDGQPEQYTNPNPFFEIEACWGYIGYVNMLQYHVTSEAEVRRAEKWMEWTSWTAVRNSDIVLDEQKLTALLEVALQSSPHHQPYTGTGALSAFASES